MDYMLYKVGLSMNDCPEELYDDWEDVVKWFEEKTKSVEMTDFDWWDLISSQDRNAYYQKFYLVLNDLFFINCYEIEYDNDYKLVL